MGTLRIISGKWRSRRLVFKDTQNIRPTPNMVRETLFNWIGDRIVNSNCLDLFAGSGALSFESLSRGAAQVVTIDANLEVIKTLKNAATILKANNITIFQAKIPQQLQIIKKHINYQFDVVFLDPPFYLNLIPLTCERINNLNILKDNSLIYIETEKNLVLKPLLPTNWQIIRHKTLGQVEYSLVTPNKDYF